jgi:hypothetical protein
MQLMRARGRRAAAFRVALRQSEQVEFSGENCDD